LAATQTSGGCTAGMACRRAGPARPEPYRPCLGRRSSPWTGTARPNESPMPGRNRRPSWPSVAIALVRRPVNGVGGSGSCAFFSLLLYLVPNVRCPIGFLYRWLHLRLWSTEGEQRQHVHIKCLSKLQTQKTEWAMSTSTVVCCRSLLSYRCFSITVISI
jgi:hypothetical protein